MIYKILSGFREFDFFLETYIQFFTGETSPAVRFTSLRFVLAAIRFIYQGFVLLVKI